MPARLAIALHADGWWIRDEIVWSKANPMPSSVKDRSTPAHEMIYMLSKKGRYYYDRVAIAEPIETDPRENYPKRARITGRGGQGAAAARGNDRDKSGGFPIDGQTRNKRSVWHMALEPFAGAHFATAPTGIVRPCILAGTSQRGVCPTCGAPWVRETERQFVQQEDISPERGVRGADGHKPMDASSGWAGFPRGRTERQTTGWSPSCQCPDNVPVPATVLDPFGGSGTTALVANDLGRDAVLIELNPEYAKLARDRLRQGLQSVESGIADDDGSDLPLFGASA